MSQISHRGRSRSSGDDISRAQSSKRLRFVAGLGHRRLTHVVGDVEVGIVHPYRCRLAEQRESDDLSQLRHQMQPALHMGPHRVEPEPPAGIVQWAALEDPDGAHVHGCLWGFHVKERRIKLRQKVD